MTEICVHCGTCYEGGYCWASSDGSHIMENDPDQVDPWDCCTECGILLAPEVLDGIAEHHCDPERVIAFQAWLTDLEDNTQWDYRR